MGNITSIGGGPQQVVRLVRHDGKVLEFYDDMPAEELLVVYPDYVVCQDQIEESGQVRRKLLAANDVLLKGQVYLLLNKRTLQPHQQKAQHPNHKSIHHGNRVHGNGAAPRVSRNLPMDVPTAGREHSAHPQHMKVTVKPVFPKGELGQIMERGSVKIITAKGTHELSGRQLTQMLNPHRPYRSSSKSSLSPSSLRSGLESIPEEPHHKLNPPLLNLTLLTKNTPTALVAQQPIFFKVRANNEDVAAGSVASSLKVTRADRRHHIRPLARMT
ncbi:hypothetical protein R1sor_027094 [Riccia sorocarpa]|uniref:Uncharacterized protein n=1 Tax=Riccia sorocarpa TaxID=122646 RepID=A0ABD3GEY5_9MARC